MPTSFDPISGLLHPHYGVDSKGEDIWPSETDDYYKRARYWLEAMYEEAKYLNDSSDDVKEVQKFIDYLVGKQWPGNRPSYKSRPVHNKLWGIFWELVSLLTDIRPIYKVTALDRNFEKQSQIINKLTKAWWLASDADLNLALCIIYGLLCTGYAKLTWNKKLRNGEGDFDMLPLGPTDVLQIGARTDLNSASCVIYQTVMPLHWFREQYPIRGNTVKPDPLYSRYDLPSSRPAHIAPLMYDMLSPQMKRLLGQPARMGTSAFPRALYREFWFDDDQYNTSNRTVLMGKRNDNWHYEVPPGSKLYPRGRLVVMGGDAILHDGPNPFWHAMKPFVALRLNVVPWQWHGLSEMKSQMALQDILNNILGGIMDSVKKAVNPAFMAPRNAFSDQVWSTLDWSMPGAKAAFNPMTATKPEFSPAPVLPAFVIQVYNLISQGMDRSSGLAAISELLKKKQVPSGDTLDTIKQGQQTPLRLKGRNIEVFLRQLGSMAVPNFMQFYTKSRRIYMLGSEGATMEDFDYNPDNMIPAGKRPEDHIRNFVFEIEPGSLLNAQKVERVMMMMNLRRSGDMSRRRLIEAMDIGIDPDKLDQELKQEREEGIGPVPMRGKPQAPHQPKS